MDLLVRDCCPSCDPISITGTTPPNPPAARPVAQPRKAHGAGAAVPAGLPRGGHAAACHVPGGEAARERRLAGHRARTARERTRSKNPARGMPPRGRAGIPGAPFSRACVRELRGPGGRGAWRAPRDRRVPGRGRRRLRRRDQCCGGRERPAPRRGYRGGRAGSPVAGPAGGVPGAGPCPVSARPCGDPSRAGSRAARSMRAGRALGPRPRRALAGIDPACLRPAPRCWALR